MGLTSTQICNMALTLIGNSQITSIDGADEKSRVCKLFYDQTRDEVLASSGVEWNGATRRRVLGSPLSTDPAFGWDYQFQLPSDPPILRVIAVVSDSRDKRNVAWKREADRILTNSATCYIIFIRRFYDVSLWSPLLIQAVYTLLASKLARRLSQNPQQAVELLREYYDVVLPKAKMAEAEESYVEDEKGVTTWAEAGRSDVELNDYPSWALPSS